MKKKSVPVGQAVVWAVRKIDRRGTVMAIVPPGSHPGDAFHRLKEENKALRFAYEGCATSADVESYLVAVHGASAKAKTIRVYWVKRLEVV